MSNPYNLESQCAEAKQRVAVHIELLTAGVEQRMASDFARSRLDSERRALTGKYSTVLVGFDFANGVTSMSHTSNCFQFGGRIVARWEGPNIYQLDVPYIVWAWLRITPAAKFLRRLWVGERTSK